MAQTAATECNASPSPSLETFTDLAERITKLERCLWNCATSEQTVTPQMRRARSAVESKSLHSAQWKWVPKHYYDLPLSDRAKLLGAPTTSALCKAVLLENRACDSPDCSDPTNSRFYMVIVQYDSAIDNKKLQSEIRALRPPGNERIDPSKFDFRLASEEDNDRLTGYEHNSVSPFGLLDGAVPIVLAKSICGVEPAFMWMGGGHVNVKLGMAVEEFVRGTGSIVIDISE